MRERDPRTDDRCLTERDTTRPRRAHASPLGASLAVAAALTNCSDSLPSPSEVRGLRILAVASDPPELGLTDTGAVLSVTAVDGAEGDAGRARSIRWFLCDDRATDEPVRCAGDPSLHALAGDGDSLVVSRARCGARGSCTVLVALCPGRPAAFDRERGSLACPDEAGLAWARTEGVVAFKTVRIAPADRTANRAPAIESLTLEGAGPEAWSVTACDAPPCASRRVTVLPGTDSAEGAGATREVLTASFFATAGAFDRPRALTTDGRDGRDGTLSARWTPPTRAGLARIWVVLRDDRGGVVVSAREVTVTR
jgi:hypothetical protein